MIHRYQPTTPKSTRGSIYNNVNERQGMLDHALVTAEVGQTVVKVMKDGSGEFKTITDAVNSIPADNTKCVIVYIGGGEYNEKITIPISKE
ncbi:hypothetical protein CerSpe_093230 [Prunus speciosa]